VKQNPKSPPKRPNFGETVPGGDVRELGDETGWQEWNQALEQSDRQFAHTAPMTAPAPAELGDPRYAKTRPASLPATRDGPGTGAERKRRPLTSDVVMVEARKNNRVCPRPRRWAELFGLFAQWVDDGADLPSPPLTGDSWARTPALAKRMAFRAQIEWSEKAGCIDKLFDYVKALPEDEWFHMGES
jgi:hypothetical protein